MKRLASTFITLVYDAALKSHWRRIALSRFLRQAGVAESFLATWGPEESKRQFLDRLFARLPAQTRGQDLIVSMARDLAQQDAFPDLQGWEDSAHMLQEARMAVGALRRALAQLDDQVQSERDRQEAQRRARKRHEEVAQSRQTLDSLAQRINDLALRVGSPQAGYEFQAWFYDLMDFCEVTNRRPYISGGRQIDGSITILGTTYLVELKFTKEQTPPCEVDSLLQKVHTKADNTMGIMLSMSGYTSTAVTTASGARTPLLLMDHRHVYLAGVYGEIGTGVPRNPAMATRFGPFTPPESYYPIGY